MNFKREKDSFLGKGNGNAQDIVKMSVRASYGVMEREVVVPSSNVKDAVNKLKRKGFKIIGLSHGDTKFKKIWFTQIGGI